MKRGHTDAETCRLNGWGVGTRLVGDEGYGPTIIQITALGEVCMLARAISRNGGAVSEHETSWTLECRDWVKVDEQPAAPDVRGNGAREAVPTEVVDRVGSYVRAIVDGLAQPGETHVAVGEAAMRCMRIADRELYALRSRLELLAYGTDWTGADPVAMRDELRRVLS